MRRTIVLFMLHFVGGDTIEFYVETYRTRVCDLADDAGREYTTWDQVETVH